MCNFFRDCCIIGEKNRIIQKNIFKLIVSQRIEKGQIDYRLDIR